MSARRKRSRSRVLWVTILVTLLGVAMVLLTTKSGRAKPGEKGAAPIASGSAAPAPHGKEKDGKEKDGKEKDGKEKEGKEKEAHGKADKHGAEHAEAAKPDEDLMSIPLGKGLPVHVNVAVFFLDVTSFDDTKGEFEGTVDVRLRWTDPRLAFPAKDALRGYKEANGKAAEELLTKIWTPTVDVQNRPETGPYVGRRVRTYADGTVESLMRTSGKYKIHVHYESFPFDRQKLAVDLIVRDETIEEVELLFDTDDVEFSHAARTASLDGWDLGIVDLHHDSIPGWSGDRFATVTATLFIDRDASGTIAPVFVPLVASLLIPLLALWMNKATEDGFEVEAFELANMGIGGLFSVIALSFAIYSSNPIIASGDNTVTRLFGLNYGTLALSLAIVVLFFRYELPKRLFGAHVQQEAFRFLAWALPLLSIATSLAFVLVAAA